MIESQSGVIKVYEDDKVVAILPKNAATIGHVLLIPKDHHPIIEQVPDFIITHLFQVANKLSIVLFEGMNALGTNIIVNNGVAAGQTSSHFMVHIIPRRENDGLDFTWQPKQLSQEELATIEMKVKEETSSIGQFEDEKPEPINLDKEETVDLDDLQVRALDRMP
jgi:histidine triad (HIT) family protein